MQPETKYAQSPNGAIGYQVFGDSRYLDRLASFSRVILFDKLGTGVSDPWLVDPL